MNDSSSSSSGGIGFTSGLTLLFIGLKLGNVITWPWLWVLAPTWLPVSLVIVIFVIAALMK